MAFYYVPAPAKKSAIMRDWVVMALCRPFFPELILHWHSYGLGEWASKGNDWRRRITQLALGKADLSIVLNNYNKRDAGVFAPKRIEVVANGIADRFPDYETSLAFRRQDRAAALKALGAAAANESRIAGQADTGLQPVRFLFLGHLIESKGVFVAIEATALANAQLRKANAAWRANLTLAGSFASEKEKARILAAIDRANEAVGEEGPCVLLAGFLDSGKKKSALEKADCLVFPTFYENEAQPLVLLEAMSAGLPVITSSWRGVPEVLPELYPSPVEPNSKSTLARALLDPQWRVKGGALRHHYQARFTVPIHVAKLSEVLSGNSSHV
jgi:glycosyltransferase involved in cell wall biosynthesis